MAAVGVSTAEEPRAAATKAPSGRRPWQHDLADAFRDPRELCRFLSLGDDVGTTAVASTGGFPFLVPRSFADRMQRGNPRDPLLLQVLPRVDEVGLQHGYSSDPLDESRYLTSPGLVQKYSGRALLLVTGGCAVNCRYCFRRSFPYAESGATRRGLETALDAIAEDRSLNEVILSGGDPLLADDATLATIIKRLDGIPHVARLRIHTRLPIVLPSRVDEGLLGVLAATRLSRVIVIHANHPAELDETVAGAIGRLLRLPAIILNQSVLLAGVNDSVASLQGLSERLVTIGVVPYYLHLLDRVHGAAHFDVPEAVAVGLHRQLMARLPGYAVPKLVREIPGETSKTWVNVG